MSSKKSEKYTKYSAEDFIQSNSFQNFVFATNKRDVDFWSGWIRRNPDAKKEAQLASDYLRAQATAHSGITESDVNTELEKFLLTIEEDSEGRKALNNNSLSPIRNFRKIAAAISLILVASTVAVIYQFNESPKEISVVEEETRFIEKTNPRGQKLTFQLPDGSQVKLNAEGKVRFPRDFNKNERIVYLEGEAFFDVTRDVNWPFKVITENIEVGVLGTSFAVSAYPGESNERITVESGKVKVSGQGDESVVLLPNEMAIYDKMEYHLEKGAAEEKYLAWRNEKLIFNKAGVDEMVKTLERWYNVDIEVENTLNKKMSITGEFKNQPLKNVLIGIGYSSGFEHQIEGNNVKIVITK